MYDLYVILFILIAVLFSITTGKLTFGAAVLGGILSIIIFKGTGLTSLLMLSAFFVLGSIATSWRFEEKASFRDGESKRRNGGQVWANAGMAAILACFAIFFSDCSDLLKCMIAGVFASATADTLSSELGNLYGKSFYNVITLKRDKRGLDGVISLEGTLIGLVGSVIIATIYSIANGWTVHFYWIIIAGTLGNFTDSFLGASLERKNRITNNTVNFLNTVSATFFIWLIQIFS
ncbi:MAG: DUF92 domain-containing protein [Pyrinomonadaceae bacterium]|nr:DUF92 domain-containing protein [Sphingobacteriaceae bacterium]